MPAVNIPMDHCEAMFRLADSISARQRRRFPGSMLLLVNDSLKMSAELATNEGVMQSGAPMLRIENYLRQGQEATLKTRLNGGLNRLAL